MSEYKGTIYRSVSDFGIENVDAFVKLYPIDVTRCVFLFYLKIEVQYFFKKNKIESFPVY